MEHAAIVQRAYRGNQILAALPAEEAETLLLNCKVEQIRARESLFEPNEVLESVYFPIQGMVSLVTTMLDGYIIEMATVGQEGVVGVPMVMGSGRIGNMRGVAKFTGSSVVVSAAHFKQQLAQGGRLSACVSQFVTALFSLVGQNAACNRLHTINQRLARWLLMTYDRLGVDRFNLTHEFMAQMLGARRASVTEAAASLQSTGAIDYKRGNMSILDRSVLEDSACECYEVINSAYKDLYVERVSPI